MAIVKSEIHNNIAVLTLNNGTTNAINPDLVYDLSGALDKIRGDAKGIVLCGGAKFFSIGLDLPALIQYDRAEMSDFWYQFNRLVLDFYTISLPTVCVLAGHAVAGGNILALTCDYRFAGIESKKIGLNEIKLGVPVPYLADMLLRQVVDERTATEMLYSGDFRTFAEAKTVGLIDALYSADTVLRRAMDKVSHLSALPANAFAAIKSCRISEIKSRYEKHYQTQNKVFLDCWFSTATQRTLRDASRKF